MASPRVGGYVDQTPKTTSTYGHLMALLCCGYFLHVDQVRVLNWTRAHMGFVRNHCQVYFVTPYGTWALADLAL